MLSQTGAFFIDIASVLRYNSPMREDFDRLKERALRYATPTQRRHIEQTRHNWCLTHGQKSVLLVYLPDTHPEFVSVIEIAQEIGVSGRLIEYILKPLADANNDWPGKLPRALWDLIYERREDAKCLKIQRTKMKQLSRTA